MKIRLVSRHPVSGRNHQCELWNADGQLMAMLEEIPADAGDSTSINGFHYVLEPCFNYPFPRQLNAAAFASACRLLAEQWAPAHVTHPTIALTKVTEVTLTFSH